MAGTLSHLRSQLRTSYGGQALLLTCGHYEDHHPIRSDARGRCVITICAGGAAQALSIDTLMATPFPTDLVAAPSGGADRVGVEQQRRAQHPDRRADAGHRADGRPHRSQMARGHELHRRRRAVDHRAGLHERREDDRLRARRRREPAGRIAEPGAAAGRHRSSGVRGAGRRRHTEAARPRQRRRAVAEGTARRVGLARTDLERRSRRPPISRRDSSTRAAAHRACRGRRTDRCSRSRAGAARTATSACSRSRRRSCATSIRRSIATATPVWSPDGSRIAWIRQGAAPRARMFSPRREVDEPWSLRVADVKTGHGATGVEGRRRIRQRLPGRGRRQPAVLGRRRSAGRSRGRRTAGCISIPFRPAGGKATLLTPGNFEVEYVNIAPDRRAMIYNSNQDDIDKRHVWTVPVDGSAKPARNAVEVDRQRMAAGR